MPQIPEGAKTPQDRKPAAQAEAEGDGTLTVEWEGHEFTIPASADDWSARTTLAFEEGKAVSGVRGILGTKQFASLMEGDPNNRQIGELYDLIAEVMGLDAGE